MAKNTTKTLSEQQTWELLEILKNRFNDNLTRHTDVIWDKLEAKLKASPQKLWSLHQMEITDGEPDVVACDKTSDEYTFFDCAPESPKVRRSLCYDRKALDSRKNHPPKNNAVDMAAAMGIALLSEAQYRAMQSFGKFDTKTSSWLNTPPEIRKLGGAIFGDFRFDTVFIYHNGAESYYGTRGFRGFLKV